MRRRAWGLFFGVSLVGLSSVLYYFHFTIFHDSHHIFIYLLGDIAFVPIDVFLVTLIIHRVVSRREKRVLLQKLNMLIGVFFSEVGTRLLVSFSDWDPEISSIRKDLIVEENWTERDFKSVYKKLQHYSYHLTPDKIELEALRYLLNSERDFLVRLLENPSVLEHEKFTGLLRAVFHLTEELANRQDISALPDKDHEHLANDIRRVYVLLVTQWLDYMGHLKDHYPFLFSLSMRTNPFDQEASPMIEEKPA